MTTNEIVIVDYNPAWRQEFARLAQQLRDAAKTEALRIDHIGSTAVAGLAAKDVIDIQITVADLSNETVAAALVAMGYQRVDGALDAMAGVATGSADLQKVFLREPSGQRRCHVHVREAGRLNQRYALLFRDFLRTDPVICQAYAIVKRELAARFADDVESYYAIKDPYMDTVYRAAQAWAQTHAWQPDDEFC